MNKIIKYGLPIIVAGICAISFFNKRPTNFWETKQYNAKLTKSWSLAQGLGYDGVSYDQYVRSFGLGPDNPTERYDENGLVRKEFHYTEESLDRAILLLEAQQARLAEGKPQFPPPRDIFSRP